MARYKKCENGCGSLTDDPLGLCLGCKFQFQQRAQMLEKSMRNKLRSIKKTCSTCAHFQSFPDFYEDPQEDDDPDSGGMCTVDDPKVVERDSVCPEWKLWL